MSILKETSNFIDVLVSLNGEEPWQCTFIYGHPHTADRQLFWTSFHQNRIDHTNKWCVIGDVNIVADHSEKDGGAPVNNNQAKWFLDFMDASDLIELPIKGGMFT
ncbi:hypothetical protein V6N11_039883 [Hibiscus sabdariffa]|uniref:Endonuclease/exonuclease/phosphatase domain-containing protein n=1 Tax=Hibiscus sabdariffa TaxID=183260 RepID=A0ABR2RFT1_9ROSI